MLFPVRCFTCGKVVGNKWEKYKKILLESSPNVALNTLGIKRYCCRQVFLCHIDIIDELLKYRDIN